VLDASRARFADGEADVLGGLAAYFELIAEAGYGAPCGGEILGDGGQEEFETRNHTRVSPLRRGRTPNPSIEARRASANGLAAASPPQSESADT
jgi:hypothetical protein